MTVPSSPTSILTPPETSANLKESGPNESTSILLSNEQSTTAPPAISPFLSTKETPSSPTPDADLSNLVNLFRFTTGPRDAEIMLVGESWGASEAATKLPFQGTAGQELNRMLNEARLDRNKILVANVVNDQPHENEMWHFFHPRPLKKDSFQPLSFRGLHPSSKALADINKLYALVNYVRPKLIIAAGNYAFWAFCEEALGRLRYSASTGKRIVAGGISDFRGSMLMSDSTLPIPRTPILPILHPASILRNWSERAITVQDLRARVPQRQKGIWSGLPHYAQIEINPTFDRAKEYLSSLLHSLSFGKRPLSVDVETRKRLITCCGIATSRHDAFVLPFFRRTPDGFTSYFSTKEEAILTRLLLSILTHPNAFLIGQNFIYDLYYFWYTWGVTAKCSFDTMLAHHLVFPGTEKGLGRLSSMYCEYHRYWKDDNHEWDAKTDMDEHYLYNGEDCLRTYEIYEVTSDLIIKQNMQDKWEFELKKNSLAFKMMRKGVYTNSKKRNELLLQMGDAAASREQYLLRMVKQEWVDPSSKTPWYTSPDQQKTVFYDILGLPPQKHRKTGAITLDKEAIPKLKTKAPYLSPIFDSILELRSINVFRNTFLLAPLRTDGRFSCSFNPGGTDTFRWSSSENPVGEGTNMQNIPKGTEE